MIRKKRMGKGIAKILSGLLVFGMVAGLVPTVPGGTVHAKAEGESEPGVTAEQSEENFRLKVIPIIIRRRHGQGLTILAK